MLLVSLLYLEVPRGVCGTEWAGRLRGFRPRMTGGGGGKYNTHMKTWGYREKIGKEEEER